MSLTSIIRDFAVRSGLIVEGTNVATSATGMTGTLQVNGGAAIAKNLIVGTTTDLFGASTIHDDLTVKGSTTLVGLTATNAVSITTNTQATTGGAGSLQVTGGAYLGGNLVVGSIAASTTTVESNALYIVGGVGVNGSLYVAGPAIFENDVLFTGDTTYVYSTNTVYTDNFIDLHVPNDSSLVWGIDDGRDIGLIFNYYDIQDRNGFLGIANDTKFLEWYSDGVESAGTFTSSVYGTFKTGSAILADNTEASNSTTGALQVTGGIGIGGAVNAGTLTARNLTQGRVVVVGADGQLIDDADLLYDVDTNQLSANISSSNTSSNLSGGAAGSLVVQTAPGVTGFIPIGQAGLLLVSNGSEPIWTTTGTIVAGAALTATNLTFGEQYQIPYQTAPGNTAFEDNFKYRYDTDTLVTVNGQFTGTNNATSAVTGALQVVGGIGVGNSIFVGQNATISGSLFANGGNLNTLQTTFDLVNTTATTVNFAGVATAITIGAVTGSTTIRNVTAITNTSAASSTATGALRVEGGVGIGGTVYIGGSQIAGGSGTFGGDVAVNGGDITTNATSFTLANTTATTVNAFGAATIVNVGAASGTLTLNNPTIVGSTANVTLFDTIATTVNFANSATTLAIGNAPDAQTIRIGSASTGSSSYDFAAGPTASGNTKTINIGTNAEAGSTVNINLGSAASTNLLTFNADTVVGSNTTQNIFNTVATTVNLAGAATTVSIGAATGTATINNANTVVTGDLAVNGGDLTSTATSFDLLNTGVTTLNLAGAGTAIIIGAVTGATTIRNQVLVTSSTFATSAGTGALVVTGGVGVTGNIWVNDALRVVGQTTLGNVTAATSTATTLNVTGAATVGGTLSVTDSQNSNATTNGAIRVTGGVGIVKDVTIGGALTVGVTAAATSSTVVPALYSNNMLISTYTSGAISGTSQVDLDSFSSSVYRSARYFVQIVDGSNVHISEISIFHDGVKAYINEYGIATNNGQLGNFDATYGANVTIKFTPTNATSMVIKMVRTSITL